jgi:FKBP-type peptidyl-prolyl cis-trans isomerase FkpA
MKKILFSLLLIGAVALNSCTKTAESGCTPATVASEKAAMVAFCTANGITYTEHPSGILYQIIAPGTGAQPVSTSTVSAIYTGQLLSGATFDATATPRTFPLSNVIDGWKIGIPLIKVGGRIRMVIPSALGYSCVGNNQGPVTIPGNSPLYFDVTVTAVN